MGSHGKTLSLFDMLFSFLGEQQSEPVSASLWISLIPSWSPAPFLMSQVTLCFSPVGNKLRIRSRKFPAIVNCTAINWFHEWPQQALESVSLRFLQNTKNIEVRRGRIPLSVRLTSDVQRPRLKLEVRSSFWAQLSMWWKVGESSSVSLFIILACSEAVN